MVKPLGSHSIVQGKVSNHPTRGEIQTYHSLKLINCAGCGEMILMGRHHRTGKWSAMNPATRGHHDCAAYTPGMARGTMRPAIYPERQLDPSTGVTIRKGPTPAQKEILDARKSDFASTLRSQAPARPRPARYYPPTAQGPK